MEDPVEKAIREVLARPGWREVHPYNIQRYVGHAFISEVLKELEARGIKGPELKTSHRYPWHTWLTYQEWCYDAEAPAGVARRQQLSIFRRHALGQARQCVRCDRPFLALLVPTKGPDKARRWRERLCPPCESINRLEEQVRKRR